MRLVTALMVVFCSFSAVCCQLQCPADITTQVLILGGGMAGVSAARRLSDHGITDFVILEAEDRLGGRMRVEELSTGVTVNVGANWIHGVDRQAPRLHPLFNLAVECAQTRGVAGLDGRYSDFSDITIYDRNGLPVDSSTLRYGDYNAALQGAYNLANPADDTTARDGLSRSGWTPINFNDMYVEWFNFDFSTIERPNVTSLAGFSTGGTETDFLQNPSNQPMDWLVTDNRGTPFLVDCQAYGFSDNPTTDPRIHLNTEVTRVEYGDECVCATATENGQIQRYCAQYGIVTFSIGVLKDQALTLFSPNLPTAKQDALDGLSNPFYYIIYALFENRFWDTEYEFIGHIANRGDLPIIVVFPESRGNIVSMPVTDTVAFNLASMSDEQILNEISTLFTTIYGDNATAPTKILSMRWGTNPHFMGSYSNIRPGGLSSFAELIRPEGRMHFAGEGTNERYHGYMHGAYYSGINTANTIQQRMSGGANVTASAILVFLIAISKILFV